MVTTGPGYMTKRQEALDAMSQILQTNPQLWSVAGDLFIKNMDWPGAQEMADRFKKILDPKVLTDDNQSPEMQAAKQQIDALTQELHRAVDAIHEIQQSAEVQKIQVDEFEAQIKAYDAETKRITAVQNSMSPEQIQDIVLGTMHAAMDAGDLVAPSMQPQQPRGGFGEEGPTEAPEAPQMAQQPEMPPEAPQQPPEGMMQ
jgi:hypothetical protein